LDEVDPRCDFAPFDLALIDDLMDAASDLSPCPLLEPLLDAKPTDDERGLSALLAPGILFRMAKRSDREDSFVSERENDGSDSNPGPLPSAFLGFDG
jgi:hypothetical protein